MSTNCGSNLTKNSDFALSVKGNMQIFNEKSPIEFVHIYNTDNPLNHKLHINKFYEIYIYVKGDADYIVGDSYYTLKKGDIVIINQYEAHKVVLKNECEYERFYILVPIDTFDEFRFNPFKNINQKHISLTEESRNKILDILYEIRDTFKASKSSHSSFKAYGLFMQFLSYLSSYISSEEYNQENSHKNKPHNYIADVLTYIDLNLAEITSAEQIAKHIGISLPYLSTTFKKTIGTPIKVYIQTKKIAYAKELLDNGASVTEACYKSGFNDCSYFIKIFKQHTGETPLKHIKNFNIQD